MGIDVNRERAIDLALSQIEKQFGKGAIMKLGEAALAADVPALPTGSLGLDLALGIGGVPRGRVVEIYGPESSGKTTLALQLIAEAQRRGGIAAFIDAEHALDVTYARKLGVRIEDLLVSQPDNGEQALEIADTLVRSRAIVVFINQIRMKIGVMFATPETTTGGNALKFYASVRLDIRRLGAIKHGDEVVGSRTRVKVVKNKVAPPFREAEFDILYGVGISKEGELIDLGAEHGILEKAGAWYAFEGERIGQGRENARDFLREHRDVAAKIEARIREKFGLKPDGAAAEPEGEGTGVDVPRAAEAARKGGRGGKD